MMHKICAHVLIFSQGASLGLCDFCFIGHEDQIQEMFFWLIAMFATQAMQLCMRFCFLLFCNSFLEQVDASFLMFMKMWGRS
jgi:hypothetical protein